MLHFPRSKAWWFTFLGILILYLGLATGRALTTQPWNDEAWYTSPSLSLIKNGTTATPLLEPVGHFWKGIDQRTYWVVPLMFYEQVPWFEIFGFSLLSARLHAMAWGLIALFSWGWIVHKLTADRAMAFATMAALACDYQFVSQTALARMDSMALGLASLAVLLYLWLREAHFGWAIFTAQLAVVACGLTHPTAGVPAFIALAFLILYLDRRRLGWKSVALAIVPYLLGVAFWGWYISFAPDLFRAQFFGNVGDIDRLGGFSHPFRAMARELGRYAGMAGFQTGMQHLYRIKLGVILVYFLAVACLFARKETRQHAGIRTLLWLWTVYFLSMTFYDNTKEVKYAIHIVALFDAVVAVWVVSWWRKGGVDRMLSAAGAAVFVSIGVGGLLYTSLIQRDYEKIYLPAALFLEHTAQPGDLILGGSELGFALGFDSNIVDDNSFTYVTHKAPVFIAMSNNYKEFLRGYRAKALPMSSYFDRLLAEKYVRVYSNRGYDIFEERTKVKAREQP
jgi:4-amino-4-deoxy-L-arabinose transferase-like glycosyltransferase